MCPAPHRDRTVDERPQACTRLYFSCLRVFHCVEQRGGDEQTGSPLIRRHMILQAAGQPGRRGRCSKG